jgi:N-acetylglucosamine kinase
MHYGIDVGGTKIEIAIYDPTWQCLDRWREPTPADDGEALLALLAGLVREADRRHGGRGSLGLGFPGGGEPAGASSLRPGDGAGGASRS